MLKTINFEGCLVVDVLDDDDLFNRHELERLARESVSDYTCDFGVTSNRIVEYSDIPYDWHDAIPINRKDNKTCSEIYEEEILPTKPLDDPKQNKFDFWKE